MNLTTLLFLAALPLTAEGTVLDARTGAPIVGALVQQEGAVAVTLTDERGRFRFALEPAGRATLALSDPAHERAVVGIAGGPLVIRLVPIATYTPPAALPPPASEGPLPPLRPGLEVDYRLRSQALRVGPAAIDGLATNDLRIAYRWRGAATGGWLLEGEGMHVQTPVNVPGLPRESNPAFSPSTWQAGGLAGRAWSPWRQTELGLAGGYRYNVTTPNNASIPFTASGIDHEQTRHALGGVALAATHWGPWRLEGRLAAYPLILATAKAPGTPYGQALLSDARLAAYYRILPGLAIGLGYAYEAWQGGGGDASHMLGVKFHYAAEAPERDGP